MILVCLEVYVYNFKTMSTLSADIYVKLVRGKVFIDQNFDGPIDLETISANAYLSTFHFHRLFTKVYRITPHQYITRKRLEKAKELLKTGEISISGVCTDVGFESHGSFTTLFKKHQGLAPKIYRDKVQLQQEKAKEQPRCFIPNCFLEPRLPGKE